MKSRLAGRLLFPLSILAVFATPAAASADEIIHDLAVTASISADRRVQFTETINYDFGDLDRHGIYRNIPVTYARDGGTYRLRLDVGEVTRDGVSEDFSESTSDGDLSLKIGDADRTITGAHTYTITYATDRAINFFPDHDELYWNVTGDGWEVPIERSSFTLTLPPGIDMSSVSTTCFTGAFGSTEQACSIAELEGNRIGFTSTRVLQWGEGLTIVVGVPKGIIKTPSAADTIWRILMDNGVLFFPVAAFAVMFFLWWRRGRDPRLGTVIPEYEPPQKLTPALVASIKTNGEVPSRTVTATIIDLARRGYLKIRFGEEKHLLGDKQTYTFVKLKEADGKLTEYEDEILTGLFSGGAHEVAMSDLRDNKFYSSVASYNKKVQAVVDGMKVFSANPAAVRGAYIAVGFIMVWCMFFFFGAIFGSSGLGTVSAIATGLIVVLFGIFMPQRTPSGVKLLADIKGFEWFLSVTEKDRLDFHNAPERTPEQFMAFLPYAIAFGVETKWAAQFASLTIPPPSWAEGAALTHWNTMNFASNLSSLHSAAAASGYSAPSSAGSGGSGFSGGGGGGGFGGGGGGSW